MALKREPESVSNRPKPSLPPQANRANGGTKGENDSVARRTAQGTSQSPHGCSTKQQPISLPVSGVQGSSLIASKGAGRQTHVQPRATRTPGSSRGAQVGKNGQRNVPSTAIRTLKTFQPAQGRASGHQHLPLAASSGSRTPRGGAGESTQGRLARQGSIENIVAIFGQGSRVGPRVASIAGRQFIVDITVEFLFSPRTQAIPMPTTIDDFARGVVERHNMQVPPQHPRMGRFGEAQGNLWLMDTLDWDEPVTTLSQSKLPAPLQHNGSC